MVKGLDAKELRRLAQVGAQARLADIDRERENLLRVFPGLRHVSVQPDGLSRGIGNSRLVAPRKRSKMSAAARKAVSARMKEYWANRRATPGKRKGAQ
jgi:hypothetical protein